MHFAALLVHCSKLRCCGSSLWLKSRYGLGYNLTISKQVEQAGSVARRTRRLSGSTGRGTGFLPPGAAKQTDGAVVPSSSSEADGRHGPDRPVTAAVF